MPLEHLLFAALVIVVCTCSAQTTTSAVPRNYAQTGWAYSDSCRAFDRLWTTMDSIHSNRSGGLTVLYIGGSHVQGGWIGHEMRRLLAAWEPQAEMSRGIHLPYRLTPHQLPISYRDGGLVDSRSCTQGKAKHGVVAPLQWNPRCPKTQPPFNTSATFLILPERPTSINCGPTPNERNGIGQKRTTPGMHTPARQHGLAVEIGTCCRYVGGMFCRSGESRCVVCGHEWPKRISNATHNLARMGTQWPPHSACRCTKWLGEPASAAPAGFNFCRHRTQRCGRW